MISKGSNFLFCEECTSFSEGVSSSIASKLPKMFCIVFLLFSQLNIAKAQTYSWTDMAEKHLRDLGMLCSYVYGSARDVSVIEQDNNAKITLISVRYDYRCEDKYTKSDTAYFSLSEGGWTRICYAFEFYNDRCTLYGRKYSIP